MKYVEIYLSLAGTVLGLLFTTVTLLLKFIKSTKAKKVAQTLLKVTSLLIPFIEEAETFINYTGKEKKAYVVTKITQLMIEQKINVDQERVSEIIEDLVSLTKKVNIMNSRSPKELDRLYDFKGYVIKE